MMSSYFNALSLVLAIAFCGWLVSWLRHNVNIVDSLWSLMFLTVALFCAWQFDTLSDGRAQLVLALVALWALRLSVHLFVRNWGKPEDRRYQEIRANNNPGFGFKSIYLVFGLQAVLAWVIAIPLVVSVQAGIGFHWLDLIAAALWLVGWLFQSVADWQLLTFKRNQMKSGQVLNTGLWRYSRHPNYFGEFCMWWAYYLFAISAGGWWTIYSPLLMTWLLLSVSGVAMMETGIRNRRPKYAEYIERTNTFFPGRPRIKKTANKVDPRTAT